MHAHTCATDTKHSTATFTDACVLIEVVAEGALTLEAAKSVHTVATLAEARQLLALIDICGGRAARRCSLPGRPDQGVSSNQDPS